MNDNSVHKTLICCQLWNHLLLSCYYGSVFVLGSNRHLWLKVYKSAIPNSQVENLTHANMYKLLDPNHQNIYYLINLL